MHQNSLLKEYSFCAAAPLELQRGFMFVIRVACCSISSNELLVKVVTDSLFKASVCRQACC